MDLGIRVMLHLTRSRVRVIRHGSRTVIVVYVFGRWWRRRGLLTGRVLLHFHLKTHLIFGGHVFVAFLFLGGQSTPTLAQNLAQIDEFDPRVLRQNLGAHFIGKEYIGTGSTFRGGRILGTSLVAFAGSVVLNQNTTGIMARRRDIGGNFCIVSHLVLLRTGFPSGLFFRRQVFVHVTRVLGQLSKSHAWIFSLELFTHGILIQ
mmetsp:Transcript_4849/g.9270  ORF Transcript_4849/g.9270 Transcript_4849/m.9270 type:complete len:204 (+) Transcript_4849:126-737(+)